MCSLLTADGSALSPWYNRERRKNIIAYNGRGGLGIHHTAMTAGLLAPLPPSPGKTGTPFLGKTFSRLKSPEQAQPWLRRLLHGRRPLRREAAVGANRGCPRFPQSRCRRSGLAHRRQLAWRAVAVRGASISIANFCFPWLQSENNSQSAVG